MMGVDVWHTQRIIIKVFSRRKCRKCWNLLLIICSNQQWHFITFEKIWIVCELLQWSSVS